MTETRTLPLAAFTIKENKPTTPFGQVAKPPLSGASDEMCLLLRAALPSDIPSYAVVTSAVVEVRGRDAMPGSHTLTLRRHTSRLKAQVRYNTAPTYSGTASATLTRSGATIDSVWSLPVTSDVQGFVAGSLENHGWRLSMDVTTTRRFWGAVAAKLQPTLVFTYAIPGEPPSDLMPTGGAVSVAKPVLTFSVPPGTTGLQVRIDPAANSGTAWDSGTVTATAGVVDLADTSYPGLANSATTSWQARYLHADTGWSDWSDWYEFSRVDQPTLTITSPTTTPGDGTPPVAWTFTGQAAWRARILDASGRVLADSREQSGTDDGWQPPAGLTVAGATGTVEVSTRDAVVRVATPGASTWVTATRAITLTPDLALAPFSNLSLFQADESPVVTVQAVRTAGVPDEVVVYRQTGVDPETQVGRVTGLESFDEDGLFTFADVTVPPNRVSVYRVEPITDGAVGADGPMATITPKVRALWLIDPDDLRAAVLYGTDSGSWDADEIAVEHQPSNGETRRRRMLRLPPRGDISGDIVDTDYQSADETMAILDDFAEAESSHVYRYVAGHENVAVRVANINHRPTPISGHRDRHAIGSWSWRVTREA